MREIDLRALIQSIEAEQMAIEADGKTRQETAEKVARAWEAYCKARQEAAERGGVFLLRLSSLPERLFHLEDLFCGFE